MSMSMDKSATVNAQSSSHKRSQRSEHRTQQQDPTLALVNSKGDAIAMEGIYALNNQEKAL